METSAPSYQVKQKVYAVSHDGTLRSAVISEIATDANGVASYYVHFVDQDARLDRWVPPAEIRPREGGPRSMKPSPALVNATIMTRQQASRSSGLTTPVSPTDSNDSSCSAFPTVNPSTGSDNGAKKQGTPTNPVPVARARRDSHFFSRSKNVTSVLIGKHEVGAWYFSPYHMARPSVRNGVATCSPLLVHSSGSDGNMDVLTAESSSQNLSSSSLSSFGSRSPFSLHLCPYCLEPFPVHSSVVRHLKNTCIRHPPGDEIYRDTQRSLIVFEIDGKAERFFAENLALLSKMFLEHKALDYNMSIFTFYVLCEIDRYGCAVLGYFSKEKESPEGHNLSCFVTLPQYQGRGIGRFLVELSYEISKRERKQGSPEKPLSDLGEITYHTYWRDAIMEVLTAASDQGAGVSIQSLVEATGMTQVDVMSTLRRLEILVGAGASGGGGSAGGGVGGGGLGGVVKTGASAKQQQAERRPLLRLTAEHVRQHEERKLRRLQGHSGYVFEPAMLQWSPNAFVKVDNAPVFAVTPILLSTMS